MRELLQAGYEGFDAVPENIWVSLAPDIPYVWLNALTPEALVEQRRQPFGTARRAVLQQIAQLEQWVSNAPSATAP